MGACPMVQKRLCFVNDEIEKDEDLLRVGVEILEVRRDIEKALGASAEDEPLEGSLVYQRNINNRLLEQVQGISDIMRSRLVKRVEWRVAHASLLQRCFPSGREICSPSFVAAGIESMQLVIYPSGYAGATDHFCSIFLFAPAGATINGFICAGKHKHKINHTFEMAGAFGRTNFARFETIIDTESDTVTIALEIVEASQDVRGVAQHKVLAGDVRDGTTDEIPAEGIGSVIKLQRSASKFNGLEDVQQLPSLWTAKPIGTIGAAIPDNFHTMSEIQERSNELAARSGGRRKPPRSESTPLLHADGTSEYIPKPNQDLATLQPPLPTGVGPHAGTHGKLRSGQNGLNLSKLSPLARTK